MVVLGGGGVSYERGTHVEGAYPPFMEVLWEPHYEALGSNVIPRQARPGLAGLRPHTHSPVQMDFFNNPESKSPYVIR